MTPRDVGLRADDVVAARRAADGTGPSIEAAQTHAGGISRGAVVRFRAFRSAIEGAAVVSPIRISADFSFTVFRSSQHDVSKFSAAPILDLQPIADAIRRGSKDTKGRGSNPEVEIFLFSALPRKGSRKAAG
jgi:hypothetical protein